MPGMQGLGVTDFESYNDSMMSDYEEGDVGAKGEIGSGLKVQGIKMEGTMFEYKDRRRRGKGRDWDEDEMENEFDRIFKGSKVRIGGSGNLGIGVDISSKSGPNFQGTMAPYAMGQNPPAPAQPMGFGGYTHALGRENNFKAGLKIQGTMTPSAQDDPGIGFPGENSNNLLGGPTLGGPMLGGPTLAGPDPISTLGAGLTPHGQKPLSKWVLNGT
jgi:hypothetical protein